MYTSIHTSGFCHEYLICVWVFKNWQHSISKADSHTQVSHGILESLPFLNSAVLAELESISDAMDQACSFTLASQYPLMKTPQLYKYPSQVTTLQVIRAGSQPPGHMWPLTWPFSTPSLLLSGSFSRMFSSLLTQCPQLCSLCQNSRPKWLRCSCFTHAIWNSLSFSYPA